ncbi:MAG: hypothetical protein AABY83_15045 [Pseudomonadota bacterium]
MSEDHIDAVRDRKGIYYKSSNYRVDCESCNKGFHGNRWEAHHILPGVVFCDLDSFVKECLGVTDYNINKPYSMAGLPNLQSFILYFQKDSTVPFVKANEKTTTMLKWGSIAKKTNEAAIPIAFPGDFPCHNPVNFGHVKYNANVADYLEENVWVVLLKKKAKNVHFKPQDVKEELEDAKDHFWKDLVKRGKGLGGGGCLGVEQNIRNRYGTAKNGWWKPLCMADVPEEPVSSSLFQK